MILIELAGKIKDFRPKIITRNGKYYVNITGIKELSKLEEMQNYYSDMDENEFRIEFELNMDELELKSNKLKKSIMNDGIIKLYYEIKTKEEENSDINVINKNKENKDTEKKENKKNKDETKENKDTEKKENKKNKDKTKENKDTEKKKKDKKKEEKNNNESQTKPDNENENV